MPVSCKNGSRVQLLIPFTCYGRLKISLVQKITILFCVFKALQCIIINNRSINVPIAAKRLNAISSQNGSQFLIVSNLNGQYYLGAI